MRSHVQVLWESGSALECCMVSECMTISSPLDSDLKVDGDVDCMSLSLRHQATSAVTVSETSSDHALVTRSDLAGPRSRGAEKIPELF